MMLLQSESQLSAIYGKAKAQTIINNCDTYVFLGSSDSETCNNLAMKANVPFDDIHDMPLGGEYFFRRGKKAICTKRYDTVKDPEYQKMQAMKGGKMEFQATAPVLQKKTSDELYSLFGIEVSAKEPDEGLEGRKQAYFMRRRF